MQQVVHDVLPRYDMEPESTKIRGLGTPADQIGSARMLMGVVTLTARKPQAPEVAGLLCWFFLPSVLAGPSTELQCQLHNRQ